MADDYSALMAGTAQMFGSALNAYVSADINYDTRKWNEEQATVAWNRQMDLWNKTNTYNSPIEQMKRFEDAGLNKNLIYGQGSAGNAGTSMPTTPVAKFSPQEVRPGDGLMGALGVLNAYNDTRMKDTQIDNMKKIGKNLDLETTRKAIENVMLRNEQQYQPAMYRAKMNLQNQGAILSQEKQRLTKKQVGLTEQQTKLSETQGDALDAEILLRGQELENKALMESILRTDADYNEFRKGFIKENGFDPESSPSLYKLIYDAGRGFKGILKRNKINDGGAPPLLPVPSID